MWGMSMAVHPGRCQLYPLLRERNKTPQQFANEMDMTISQVSDYANNRRIMSYPTAKNVSDYFGIPMEELYEWIHSPSRVRRGRQPKQRE